MDLIQLTGSGGISSSTVRGSAENNITIANTNGNLTAFNVTNSQIATPNFTTGDDGFLFLNNGSAQMTVSITQSAFTDNKGDHFQAASSASATGLLTVTFSNNTLLTTTANDPNVIGGGITLNPGGPASMTFLVSNNTIQQAFDDAINVNHDPSSTSAGVLNGTISNNVIGTAAAVDSGSESSNTITVASKGAGPTTVAVTGNTIRQWSNAFGIGIMNAKAAAP